ncbi:hypothetical protein AGLY_012005 [Aphis glycines]|uniref:Uncharacterized protein n=1 Tax=Aphis glycines TaxID=307491 RepID=A0A6G0TBJ0_APHGL|nr:hypothetical protein AGLY_012005 [Aphis glycines]
MLLLKWSVATRLIYEPLEYQSITLRRCRIIAMFTAKIKSTYHHSDPNDDEYSDKEDCLNLHLSSMNIENILMENHEACAIGYVAGWVCSKLIHQECVDKLAAKKQNNPQVNLENTHIEMKSYQNPNLLYPFKNTLEFAKNVTFIKNSNNNIDVFKMHSKNKKLKKIVHLPVWLYNRVELYQIIVKTINHQVLLYETNLVLYYISTVLKRKLKV